MIGLKEFIEMNKEYIFIENFDDFISVNGISENALNWYAENIWDNKGYYKHNNTIFSDDYIYSPLHRINEMLNSVTIDILLKELNKSLASNKMHISIFKQSNNNDKLAVKQLMVPESIYDKDKIEDICNKMMWSLSSICQMNKFNQPQFLSPIKNFKPFIFNEKKYKYPYVLIEVEPIQSEIVTDFVKNNCNNKVYHICKKAIYENSIKKTGLRLKGENNGYRFIKNKVYFCCGENKEQKQNGIKIVAKSKRIFYNNKLDKDYIIFEIDCSGYNIDFYRDTYYDDKHIIYTYAYFPPKMIKEIQFEDL